MPIAFGHGPCDLDLASLVRDDLFTEQGQRSQCRTVKLDAAFAVVVYCLFQLAEGLHDHFVDFDSVNAVHRLYSFRCSFVRHHRSQAGCADRPAAAISDSAASGVCATRFADRCQTDTDSLRRRLPTSLQSSLKNDIGAIFAVSWGAGEERPTAGPGTRGVIPHPTRGGDLKAPFLHHGEGAGQSAGRRYSGTTPVERSHTLVAAAVRKAVPTICRSTTPMGSPRKNWV